MHEFCAICQRCAVMLETCGECKTTKHAHHHTEMVPPGIERPNWVNVVGVCDDCKSNALKTGYRVIEKHANGTVTVR